MKKKKRVLAVLIAFLLAASVCPVSIFSAAGLKSNTVTFSTDLTARHRALFTANGETSDFDFSTIHSYLQQKLEGCVTSIPLRSYNIPSDQIMELIDYVGNHMPEAFHLGRSFSYRTLGSYISELTVEYRYSKAEYLPMLAQFRQNAAWLLRDLSGSNLTDAEKALLIHDRIITWTAYGYCGGDTEDSPCFTAEGPLLMHEGVCSGYAKLYEYLLGKVGIASQYVDSASMNHAWNIVLIDGAWYHVDTTWDDGSWNDVIGRVSHENFLRSTAGIIDTGHTADDFTTVPASAAYDNAYWQDSFTEFVYCRGALYYVDETDAGLYKRISGASQKLLTLSGSWGGWGVQKKAASQSDVIVSNFFCLSADNGYLYYSTPAKVVQLSLPDLSAETVYAPTLSSGSYLYGMEAVDWTLTVQSGTNPVTITQTATVSVPRKYIVAYDANGGGDAPAAQIRRSGQTLTLSEAEPTRSHYVFTEWNTKQDGTGERYWPGGSYTADADVTLYAQWSKLTPVVRPEAGGVLINKANHFIYGLPVGSSVEKCLSVSDGTLTVAYSNPNQVLGTGTKVTVCDVDMEAVESYTIVVFGDVSGDGWYDGTDAYFINLVTEGFVSMDALTDAQRMACDANHDDKIDAADVKLVRQAGLLLSSVDQSVNNEDLITNSDFITYCGLIDQSEAVTEPETEQGSGGTLTLDLLRSLFTFLVRLFRIAF